MSNVEGWETGAGPENKGIFPQSVVSAFMGNSGSLIARVQCCMGVSEHTCGG